MRIGIVARPGLRDAASTLVELEGWLAARGVAVCWTPEAAAQLPAGPRETCSRDAMAARVELVLVLGGDGTLLGMADRIAQAERDIPILGVNFGSLGFLTEITRPELFDVLARTLAGQSGLDERLVLRAVVRRADGTATTHHAANDVVFSRGALSPIVELVVHVGEQFVTQVRADGLIVATPTGSTAYNLAAGGPIVHPSMQALVITPIAPHTLSNRPIVVPAEREVTVQCEAHAAGTEVYVAFDGQDGIQLHPGAQVSIARAPRPLKLVRAETRTYFEVLRQKLGWR